LADYSNGVHSHPPRERENDFGEGVDLQRDYYIFGYNVLNMKATSQSKRKASSGKPPLQIEKSAGAVVFHRGAQLEYLLIRSTFWEFPKGLVDVKESEMDAVRTRAGIFAVRKRARDFARRACSSNG